MAEAVAVIGLVAAIAQLVEYASRLSSRLDELAASTNAFSGLRARLTAVVAVVTRIRKQAELEVLRGIDGTALTQVINSASEDVNTLLHLLNKALPQTKDKFMARYVKAARSISSDKDIQRASARLYESIQVISLFQTTALIDLSHGHSMDDTSSSLVARRTEILKADSLPEVSDTSSVASETSVLEPLSRVLTPASDAEEIDSARDPTESTLPQMPGEDSSGVSGLITSHRRSAADKIRCSPSCSCVCHRGYRLATPALLKSLVGQIAVSYTGTPMLAFPCTERKCKRKGQVSASMTYRLPQWLLPLALHTTLSSTALNTHVNLNTLRILPDSAEVFSVLSRGDLPKLRELFVTNSASIYDVSITNWTLIHTAYTLGHMHMVSFLLQQGADPTIPADNGSNAVERAWFFAQKSAETPGDYVLSNNDVLQTIDLDEFMQQQQYTLVHKIVLGLAKLPLATVLASSTSDVDKQDIRGNTPMWWAAAQGNLAAVRTLLDFGADYTVGGGLNQVPMHVARDAATVQLLCEYDANIDALDTMGRTPLHCFCYRQVGASPEIVRVALRHGANVNARASGKQTPLHYAVMFGNVDLIKPLLDGGAEVDGVMRSDMTPLAAAIRYNQSEAVQALIDSAPDARSHCIDQFSLLELAARWAGVQLMSMLSDNLSGHASPREILLSEAHLLWKAYEGRSLRWDKLDEAFGRLLATLGVDVHLLFSRVQGPDGHQCSADSGCLGCLPIPGAFCG